MKLNIKQIRKDTSMKDFLVIGCGRFGKSIAISLSNRGSNVTIIDINEKIIQQLCDKVRHAVIGDATNSNNLEILEIEKYDAIIVATGTDVEASVVITETLQDLGAKYIIVRALHNAHARLLELTGADRIVFPQRDMGVRLAHNLNSNTLVDYLELSPEYSIMEVEVLSKSVGKTLIDLNFRSKYQVNIMAIKSEEKINLTLSGNDVIKKMIS
ncbi:TrkA-N domain protein [Alkaliphilus metalliredigens QYMF]|uniref:TrkA-N domain protein n=1 Tax=Alkaliphilus metalliredigens (strain QYMF) TaxID=293826 RepID=A6TTB6_ALKMQ|nr:TrkA family potassium uptake protein [Alkaliphilus metalliredigens]ABR49434.1 TrkA-N domain protein [Alkaliphilus metalliredigens QYMF]